MPASRCQGRAAGRGGSAEIFLPSLCSPAHLAITQTAATTGKAFNAHFPCNPETTLGIGWPSQGLATLAGGPSGQAGRTCLRCVVGKFGFCHHIHLFLGRCIASDLCNLFSLENLGKVSILEEALSRVVMARENRV